MRSELFTVMLAGCASLAGCTTSAYCEAPTACGGDFLAGAQAINGVQATDWVATADNACVDQVPTPPEPPSLAYIPPRPAGVRAVEPSTIDWCSGLVLNNKGDVTAFDDGWYETLLKYDGWFPSVPLYTGTLTLWGNNQYEVRLTQLVSQHVELTQTCLVAQGVVMSCERLNEQLNKFVVKRLGSISGLTAVVYDNSCSDDGAGGCNCDYNVALTSDTTGPWAVETGRIDFFDSDAAPPASAEYCASGASLELSGNKGTDLFNRHGLKTLEFGPPSCSDGARSPSLGETGIDCGGSCSACPD